MERQMLEDLGNVRRDRIALQVGHGESAQGWDPQIAMRMNQQVRNQVANQTPDAAEKINKWRNFRQTDTLRDPDAEKQEDLFGGNLTRMRRQLNGERVINPKLVIKSAGKASHPGSAPASNSKQFGQPGQPNAKLRIPAISRQKAAGAASNTARPVTRSQTSGANKHTAPASVKHTVSATAKHTAPASVKHTIPATAKLTAPAGVKYTAPATGKSTTPAPMKNPSSVAKKSMAPIIATKAEPKSDLLPVVPKAPATAQMPVPQAVAKLAPEPVTVFPPPGLVAPSTIGICSIEELEALFEREFEATAMISGLFVPPIPVSPNGHVHGEQWGDLKVNGKQEKANEVNGNMIKKDQERSSPSPCGSPFEEVSGTQETKSEGSEESAGPALLALSTSKWAVRR